METGIKAGRREWIGLAVIALPCLVYAMDLTVLNLAIPALSADLKPSGTQLLWIVDVYGFMVAGLLMTMGTLGDRVGRRRILLIGGGAFAVASILAAFSTNAGMLIAMRALLGIAGATLAPSTLALVRNMFHDPRERTVAIGVWIASLSAGGAIGPVLGGALLEYFWWGSVFLIGVPVMLLLLALGPWFLPEYRDPEPRPIDLASALLSLIAVIATIYGLKRVAAEGVSGSALASIALGVVVSWVFLRRQSVVRDPMIDLKLFLAPAFSAALFAYGLGTFVAFGAFIFIGQYMQLVLGMSPLEAGIWTAPFALAFIAGSLLTPIIARRFKAAHITTAGLSVAAFGFAVLSRVDASTTPVLLTTALVTYSLGLAAVFTLATDLIVGGAPSEKAGTAAAISETGSELGGALGIALLGSLGSAVYRNFMTARLPLGLTPDAAQSSRETLGAAVEVARHLNDSTGAALLSASRDAFVQAFHWTSMTAAAVMVLTAIGFAVAMRHVKAAPNIQTAEPVPPILKGR